MASQAALAEQQVLAWAREVDEIGQAAFEAILAGASWDHRPTRQAARHRRRRPRE